mgnify:FL=1
MTCIIGFTDRESSVSWIGCDSLGSNNYTKSIESPAKAFRNEQIRNVLMGGTTSFRHLDLLKYAEDLFDGIDVYRKPIIDHKYMVTKFVPKVINLFKSGVVGESETERGGNFIVAVPGRVFEVQEDYSVLEPELGFCAVGCGEAVAMGSLVTTKDMYINPVNRIVLALKAAEQCCCGVQKPFRIICTDENVGDVVIR